MPVAALAFLVAYALPIAASVPSTVHSGCDVVIAVTWIGFGVDYLVRLVLAPRTWHFVEHNVLDLLVIALPILRPLRLLRLVALLSVLNRVGAHSLRGLRLAIAGLTVGGFTETPARDAPTVDA